MKLTVKLSHKEANLLMAILYDMAEEGAQIAQYGSGGSEIWRLSESGRRIAKAVMERLDDANDRANEASGKSRDLFGAPKGTIEEATFK